MRRVASIPPRVPRVPRVIRPAPVGLWDPRRFRRTWNEPEINRPYVPGVLSLSGSAAEALLDAAKAAEAASRESELAAYQLKIDSTVNGLQIVTSILPNPLAPVGFREIANNPRGAVLADYVRKYGMVFAIIAYNGKRVAMPVFDALKLRIASQNDAGLQLLMARTGAAASEKAAVDASRAREDINDARFKQAFDERNSLTNLIGQEASNAYNSAKSSITTPLKIGLALAGVGVVAGVYFMIRDREIRAAGKRRIVRTVAGE